MRSVLKKIKLSSVVLLLLGSAILAFGFIIFILYLTLQRAEF